LRSHAVESVRRLHEPPQIPSFSGCFQDFHLGFNRFSCGVSWSHRDVSYDFIGIFPLLSFHMGFPRGNQGIFLSFL
jgi:hypothetical protein